MTYTLFLADTDDINNIASGDSNTIRLDNVTHEDAETICKIAEKYGFTVAAFLYC